MRTEDIQPVTDKRVLNGERLFWIMAGILGMIFLLYFIGAYRFAEPARRQMREERSRYFGRGLREL